MGLNLRAVMLTDLGLARDNNEDSGYAGHRLLVVADGVGGQPAGEVASALVVSELVPLDEGPARDDPLGALRDAVEAANQRIADAGESDPAQGGMATTLTALLLSGDKLALLHVGDSRAYRLRDGELRQLTVDDTYVQWLVERGMLAPEEARNHPQRSVVVQVVQGDDLQAQGEVLEPSPGDRYLLCSDGLSDMVADEAIAETLQAHADLKECAERLIALALSAGGPDNITVALADLADVAE